MLKSKIQILIITPYGIECKEESSKIQIQSEDGIVELLPNHQNYFSIVKKSAILLYIKQLYIPIAIVDQSLLLFNSAKNTCLILSESAFNIFNISKSSLNLKLCDFKYEKKFLDYVKKFL